MTCFWDGILNALETEDFKIFSKTYGRFTVYTKPKSKEFINILKSNNTKTISIKWQGKILSENELNENFEHIKNFNGNLINNGYYCSICDPFLCLICELLNVNIIHKYLSTTIKYTKNNVKKTLHFCSNKNHFWKV